MVCGGGAAVSVRRDCKIVSSLQAAAGDGDRLQILEQIDKELSKGNEKTALNLVKSLQGKPGGLSCFGAARQVIAPDHFPPFNSACSVHCLLFQFILPE